MGADLSSENLTVTVVPKKSDEFTCMSCFLVHHRSQLDHEGKGGPIARTALDRCVDHSPKKRAMERSDDLDNGGGSTTDRRPRKDASCGTVRSVLTGSGTVAAR